MLFIYTGPTGPSGPAAAGHNSRGGEDATSCRTNETYVNSRHDDQHCDHSLAAHWTKRVGPLDQES